MAIDYTQPAGRVRLLLNDVNPAKFVFEDDEIVAFLAIEGSNVKRAAAQAIDTNADNEALAAKVLKSQDLSTDGARVAEALHKRAAELRRQADHDDEVADEVAGGGVHVTEFARYPVDAELAGYPGPAYWPW